MTPLAWGARVSPAFRALVTVIALDLGCAPSDLMACMAWESGRTFGPATRNQAGSGAVGLIQFMPQTLATWGLNADQAAAMSAEQQLLFVWRYLAAWRGRLRNLGDLYMAILWPAGIGQPDSAVLFARGGSRPALYLQNKGLDGDRDGDITRGECLVRVREALAAGLTPGNASAAA